MGGCWRGLMWGQTIGRESALDLGTAGLRASVCQASWFVAVAVAVAVAVVAVAVAVGLALFLCSTA